MAKVVKNTCPSTAYGIAHAGNKIEQCAMINFSFLKYIIDLPYRFGLVPGVVAPAW
jgi:hypothetical protein